MAEQIDLDFDTDALLFSAQPTLRYKRIEVFSKMRDESIRHC